jgi:acyl transferase domain-containing protein/acyl carrier protein
MSRELYEAEPVYRGEVDRCAQALRSALDLDLRRVMFSTRPEDEARLRDTALAQPALFVVEYALARLWSSWGVTPAAMIGHSVGELVAACLAGVLDLEEALRLVAVRGRLMASTAPGAMLAVHLAEEALRSRLPADLSIGAVNEPDWCVVSGPSGAVEAFQRAMESSGISHRRLHTSHAFHAATMDPIVEPFMREVARATLRPARLPYLSNVTGTWIDPAAPASPAYWGKHLRQTVRFSEGVDALLGEDPARTFVEVGPGQVLTTMLKRRPGRSGAGVVVASLPHPQTKVSEARTMAEALGKLWVRGHEIAWRAVHGEELRRRVPLPTYPFERQRHWVDPPRGEEARAQRPGSARAAAALHAPSWTRRALSRAPGGASDPRWLVFVDRAGWGEALVRALRAEQDEVVVVRPGAAFEVGAGGDFAVDPSSPEDPLRLVEALDRGAGVPRRIVHLLGLDRTSFNAGRDAASAGPSFNATERLAAFAGLASLIRALGRREPPGPLELTVVSNGAEAVTGEEDLAPGGATLLALVRAAEQENASLTCRSVDVSDRELGHAAWLAERLIAEARSSSPEQRVAYRGRRRWVASFDPIAIGDSEVRDRLRRGGRYLVVGGLGGIGLPIARHLTDAVAAKLLLVEDPGAPRPIDPDPGAGAIEVIRARLDDPGDLARGVREAEARLGGLDGVVYAAAIEDAGLLGGIDDLRLPDVVARLAHHDRALPALEAALAGRPLDFCVVGSSLSAILGGPGLAAYAACNLLRDAFVRQHNQRSAQPWITVSWDRLRDGPRREAAGGAPGLEPAQALRALERILAEPELDQVVVCSGDLAARLAQGRRVEGEAPAPAPRAGGGGGDALPPAGAGDRPELSTRYVPPRDEVEEATAAIWRELLGMTRVGVDDDFFELGGHSLLATRFLVRLEEQLGVELKIADLFAHPTVAALSALVRDAGVAEADPAELAELLAQVEGMSEADALAALASAEEEPA